jgi:hypothetical protein
MVTIRDGSFTSTPALRRGRRLPTLSREARRSCNFSLNSPVSDRRATRSAPTKAERPAAQMRYRSPDRRVIMRDRPAIAAIVRRFVGRACRAKAVGRDMSGSGEFTTWVALAFAAAGAGLCWIFSSSLFVLIPAALAGAYLGYRAERAGRRYLGRRFAEGP